MAIIGYARTSTREQEAGLQAQIRDLIAAGCAERDIYTEQVSSVRERPELDLLRRRILRPGDALVVTRLDRLARSARDTLTLVEEFGQRGVTLKILDSAMTIEPPGSGRSRASPEANSSMAGAMSRMILTVMAAMAQLEREIMLERQREGIARAKDEGKYKGQPPHARAKTSQVIELAAAAHSGRDCRRSRDQRALGLPHPRREPLQHQLNVARRQAGPGRLIQVISDAAASSSGDK